jgi:hypothetical protein
VPLVRLKEPHESGEAEALRKTAARREGSCLEAVDEHLEVGAREEELEPSNINAGVVEAVVLEPLIEAISVR